MAHQALAGVVAVEDDRRRQLIEVTIDCLAELGYVGTTLARIAARADVSPGLVAHYFGDKDGLLEAAFRRLGRRTAEAARARLRGARTPRERIQAVIDANLAPAEFERRSGMAWLAFWGQLLHHERLKRVQQAFQRRTLSNLKISLRQLMPRREARTLAAMIAAMIDGVWLRAALSEWTEADSEGARALLAAFVDGRLREAATLHDADAAPAAVAVARTHVTSINPANGRVLAELPLAGAREVDAAVQTAISAQPAWGALSGTQRARILNHAARLLRERAPDLARLETLDTGRPIRETGAVDVAAGADSLEYYAGIVTVRRGEHVDLGPGAFGYTHREPLGVVAGAGDWRSPLRTACSASAAALACGNAMLFTPADLAPLTATRLAQLYREAGLPEGLFQVLHGEEEVPRLLSGHPRVTVVSHPTPGSGRRSVLIVFDDASLELAVMGALLAGVGSPLAACAHGATVFAQRGIVGPYAERLCASVAALRVGDPLDPATQVGALVSAAHLEQMLGGIARARAEGARLRCGGARVTVGDLGQGYFVAPAVFDRCTDAMSIVREAGDGPVMSLLSFDDEAEVIGRVNAAGYEPSVAVYTRDLVRGHRVSAALGAGLCWINRGVAAPAGPLSGGYDLPGTGHGRGRAALEHYTRTRSVCVSLRDGDAR